MALHYVTREPSEPSPRPPLLVLLHGVGADEQDLLPLAGAMAPRFFCACVRAPYEAEPMGYSWYAMDWRTHPPTFDLAQAEESRAAVAALLPELPARHGSDPARTFLFGFSQGAAIALAVALTRPELVRGAVIHSGGMLPGIAERIAPPQALAHVEVLVLHGTDDEVVPVERGRRMRDLLAPFLGDRLTYREHDGGHYVTEATLDDAAAWLAARAG
jgi:phospholipase/carboxylesterase